MIAARFGGSHIEQEILDLTLCHVCVNYTYVSAEYTGKCERSVYTFKSVVKCETEGKQRVTRDIRQYSVSYQCSTP